MSTTGTGMPKIVLAIKWYLFVAISQVALSWRRLNFQWGFIVVQHFACYRCKLQTLYRMQCKIAVPFVKRLVTPVVITRNHVKIVQTKVSYHVIVCFIFLLFTIILSLLLFNSILLSYQSCIFVLQHVCIYSYFQLT